MKRIGFTPREKLDMLAFLRALTDSTFLTDPRFSNPWSHR
jgi:cytochrome c peroxidase